MVLMRRICAWCNKEMGIVEVEGDQGEEIETHGICSECAKEHFGKDIEDDASDSSNPIALTQNQDDCKLSKRAYSVREFIDAITGRKQTTSLGLRSVPGVDVNKAYDIFSQLESSKRFIVGDSGTSFGKTQVQIGSFLNAVANDPNAQQITGIPPGEMKEFANEWKKAQEKLSSFSWKKTTPVDLNSAESFKARNKNLVKERREGTILRVSPNSSPGVIRIINGKAIGEYLDLSELQRLGLNVSSPDIMNKINTIMQQFVTWAVVRNALGRVLAYQKMPEIHNKIMNVFSYNNVNKNEKLLNLTDKVSQSNLVAKIQDVANAARQYGYDTTAPGAFNIYQLIAIANASGSGRVIEFLKTKQPFGSGNLTYLDRANRKIQEVTGIPTSMPQNSGFGGFTSVANEEFDLVKNAKYTEQGFLYFPAQYADDIKSGKRKMAIRASDVPVEVNEIVMCMTHSGSTICEVRINSKNKMSLTRIEKAFGKRVAKSIEQQFGPGGQYFVIRFEPYKINMADDKDNWKEILIEKEGVSLTRQKIKNHYMNPGIKKKIMSRIKDKPVLIYIGAGKNENVLKRNHKGKPIVITNADQDKKNNPNNYYYWVDRKLLSIHEVLGKKTNVGFIELELNGDFSPNEAKKYANEISSKIKEKYGVSSTIYQNGGSGIHVEFNLEKEVSTNTLRNELKSILNEINKEWDGVTTGLVEGTGMRSDVSNLHNKGGIVVPGSLCESYGKEKKEIVESELDDDFGTKNIQEHAFEDSGALTMPPPMGRSFVGAIGEYYASKEDDLVKIAFRPKVKEEYIWMWDYTNHHLYFEKNVANGKEIQNVTHSVLADKNGIVPFTIETNPRGFVTFYDNGDIEVETYEIPFDDILSEARSSVIGHFELRDKYFDVGVLVMPKGTVLPPKPPKEEDIEISASDLNKLNRIWRFARIIELSGLVSEGAKKKPKGVSPKTEEWKKVPSADVDQDQIFLDDVSKELPRDDGQEEPIEAHRDVAYDYNEPVVKRRIEERPEKDPDLSLGYKSREEKEKDEVYRRAREKFWANKNKEKSIVSDPSLVKKEVVAPVVETIVDQPPEVSIDSPPEASIGDAPVDVLPTEQISEKPAQVEELESQVGEEIKDIFILNPVEICEEEGDWSIPCEEVFKLRHLYFPSEEPAKTEVPLKKEDEEDVVIEDEKKVDVVTDDEKKEDEVEVAAQMANEWEIGDLPIGEDFENTCVDREADVPNEDEKDTPLFGEKVTAPIDPETKEVLTSWPKINPTAITMSDEAWEKFAFHKLTDVKELREVFSPSSDYMSYFKQDPQIVQQWILPVLTHSIGKRWFDINKSKKSIGGAPFGMFNENDAKEIESREIKIEDLSKGKKYISEVNGLVAKYVNKYFSFEAGEPIDKYLYKYLDADMKRIVAKDNLLKEEKVIVCSVCLGESTGNSLNSTMRTKQRREKMEEDKSGKYSKWSCPNCQKKVDQIDGSDIPKIMTEAKRIINSNKQLEEYVQSEEVLSKIEANNALLNDLLEQKAELEKKKRIYSAQVEIPREHTWCPNATCPGKRIPLSSIDWENDFWKSTNAAIVLGNLEKKYGIVPPEGFDYPSIQNDDDLSAEVFGHKKSHNPPKWLDDVPFVCPHDGVKFTLREVKGQGEGNRAGFMWDPYQRTVWKQESEQTNKSKGSDLDNVSDDNADASKLANFSELSDLARQILLKKYWDVREKFIQTVAGIDFDTAMRQRKYSGQIRTVALYDALIDFSKNESVAYVAWLEEKALKKNLINQGGIYESQNIVDKQTSREEIHTPIFQKWVNHMLSVTNDWMDGFKQYRLDQWLAGEKEGIRSKWSNTYGTFFVSKIKNDIFDSSEVANQAYGFVSNLQDKSVSDPKKQGRSKKLRLMKVLGIYKIEEKDVDLMSQEEKDGITDIKSEKTVNRLMKDKIDFSNQIDSFNRHNVKMKEEAMLSVGDYILIHALVISGQEKHPSILAIRGIRDDNDENKLFEELGKHSTEGMDNPKIWEKLNKQVVEIKKQLADESPEVQLNVIKARVKELRDALMSQKTSSASLSIRSERDPLSKYKSKRDFDETSEPEGEVGTGNKHRFVIQKHQATNLHFDLRLENDDGVLQSWAIPKHKMPEGKEKLLAIETEPHPVEYAKFKGEIEEGYGKGHVDIWASGKYNPIEKSRDKIVFEINSGKASGRYTLYRTTGKKWLLMVSKSDNKKE